MLDKLTKELLSQQDLSKVEGKARFFKSDYNNDEFIGVSVPVIRKIIPAYHVITFEELSSLLDSSIHEFKLAGLLILVNKFQKANSSEKTRIKDYYLDLVKKHQVDHWDLVDSSCYQIVGNWAFYQQDYQLIKKLVANSDLWIRRVGIVGTFYFIKQGDYQFLYNYAPSLFADKRDLTQKALGWMLKENGKRNGMDRLLDFLLLHSANMGRTCLRCALEKFDSQIKKQIYN